jgi:cell division septum initiation protein DivIVA
LSSRLSFLDLSKNAQAMFIAPAEVKHQELKRRLHGYNRASVEKLLRDVVASYEQVWRERDQLKDRVDQLEKELAPLREAERLLSDSLVTAERAASEVRARAAADAEALLEQARGKRKAQEKAASEIRAKAERDAEVLLEQASVKRREQQIAVTAEQTRLKNEIDRLKTVEQELYANLRAFLRSGLELVEDRNVTQPSPPASPQSSTQKTRDPATA